MTAVQYAMFYYLGAYLYEKKPKISFIKVIFFIVISITSCIFPYTISSNGSLAIKVIELLVGNLGSISGVLMTYEIANILGDKVGSNFWWNRLKKNNFGIYLFHQQLVYPCIMLFNGKVHPIVQVLVSFLVVICVSSVITELFRKNKVTRILFEI